MKKTTPFWDFSLCFYRKDGVEPLCLELQNNQGCDVNLLLFCFWGGLTYGVIPKEMIGKAVDYSNHWRADVVQPLRDVRLRMKENHWMSVSEHHQALRDHVKSAELEAERLQQITLELLIAKLPAQQTDSETVLDFIMENLDRYFQKAGINIDGPACEKLAAMLSILGKDQTAPSKERVMMRLSTLTQDGHQ